MKVAITATGADLEAKVDPRFGRAALFILYDTEGKSFTTVDNTQNLNAAQGAGIQAGQNIVESGVSALITGNCGPKAFQVLKSSGIKVYIGAVGTVKDAIEDFREGRLSMADSPNVEGHWM
ncbi:NifB/NifX family molybdenum-iron cluster-binding protein [Thermodesulfobacteriota bacterium]